jgi:hypothetical protein
MGRFALPEAVRPQRYRRSEGTLNYSSGNSANLQVGQTDYLTSLDLISSQTLVTTATVPVSLSGAGAYGPLNLVQVKVNGARAPFSLPGYHTNEFFKIHAHDYTDSLVASGATASTTNNWVNHLRIPLTVDPSSEVGSWYTADTQLNLTTWLTFNAVSVVYTTANSATMGGSYQIISEKFSAPPPDVNAQYDAVATAGYPGADTWLNKISFYRQVQLYGSFALSNGTTPINIETDQDIVRIILIFYTGALNASSYAPADALYTSLSLKVNDVANIYDTIPEASMRFDYLTVFKLKNTAGTTVIDFMRTEPPTRRDILPTDADKVRRLQLNILSTSASNSVDVVVESLVDSQFAQRWVNSAKAKAGG